MTIQMPDGTADVTRDGQRAISRTEGSTQHERAQYSLSSLLVATALIASILAAFVAWRDTYEVHGAIGCKVLPVFLGFFIVICVPFLLSQRLRRAACIVMILGCIAFGVRQAILKNRLRELKAEVTQIVAYLEKCSLEKGKYPDDLSGYTFRNVGLKPYIIYNSPRYSPHAVVFHPTKYTGTGHWYYPGYGFYFEDD